MAAVDPKILSATKDALGKVIKKPPLTEKLLGRPPFKFLHDVIVNVVSTSEHFKDVFSQSELVADNVANKEAKIQFLQKCIDAVESKSGQKLEVKPTKIVAGLEAEKTNAFLQALANVALNGPTKVSKPAVTTPKKKASTPKAKETASAAKEAPPKVEAAAPKEISPPPQEEEKPIKLTVRPPTTKKQVTKEPDDEEEYKRPQTVRPTTARAAPPRIQMKRDFEEAPSADVLAAAAGTSETRVVTSLISESGDQKDEDENDEIVERDDGPDEAIGGDTMFEPGMAGDQKGSLVQKLLETKKELEGSTQDQFEAKQMTQVESQNIEKIRNNLQMLTNLATPIGNLFDYLHEDIDLMLAELKMWNDEIEKGEKEREKKQATEEKELQELRDQLEVLEREIADETDKITATKAAIERNDEKMRKMIMIVVEKG